MLKKSDKIAEVLEVKPKIMQLNARTFFLLNMFKKLLFLL